VARHGEHEGVCKANVDVGINALGRQQPLQLVLFFFKNRGVLQKFVTFRCDCQRSRGLSAGSIKYDEKSQ
jgi:hypothetical protein